MTASSRPERGRARLARSSALATLALACCLAPAASLAQPRPGAAPTAADLALGWSLGEFGSPLICDFAGEPVRGMRRIEIVPGPRGTRPPVDRIVFADMEVEEASRCYTSLEPEVPNVIGWVDIRLPGKHHPDAAERDFRTSLRRKRGFEFTVPAGRLEIRKVGQPAADPRTVDFRSGRAKLVEVARGTDADRLLASFRDKRRLLLEIESRDGTRLSFPLFLTGPTRAERSTP